jgi:hypothetical protein
MPIPGSLLKFAAPVGAAVSALSKIKSGQRLLSAIRRLSPDERGELEADTKKLEAALADLSHALRSKLHVHDGPGVVTWSDARDERLHPPPEFDVAKRIVEAVRGAKSRGESPTTSELSRAVEAVGDDDGTFRAGLHIAESDGYIHRSIKRRWETTPLADGDPTDAPHVVAIEQRIVEHVKTVGVVDNEELALFVGVEDATSPEFLAALERALADGQIAWLGWGTYGLPPEKLKRFKGPGPDPRPATDTADVGAATRKVGALTLDITRKLARIQKGSLGRRAEATDPASRLKALAELHESGVINDEEFEKKKAELLALL